MRLYWAMAKHALMRHMGTLIFTGMANWSLVNIISVRSENHLNLIFCLFMSRHPWKVFVCLNFVFVFVLFVICLTKFFRWLLVWTRWTVPTTARSGSISYVLLFMYYIYVLLFYVIFSSLPNSTTVFNLIYI